MEYLPCGDTASAVFDYTNKRLSALSVDDFLNQRNEPEVCYKDTFPGTIKLFPTKFNTELSFGFYDDCMFYLQKNNQILQKLGDFPYRDAQEKQIENRLRLVDEIPTTHIGNTLHKSTELGSHCHELDRIFIEYYLRVFFFHNHAN